MFKGIITAKESYPNRRAYIQIKEDNRAEFSYTIKRDMLAKVLPFNVGDEVQFSFENPISKSLSGETNYPFITAIELCKN